MYINEKQKELLSSYITEDEAFGPINASEIEEPEALQILFDSHNKIYKALHQRPSIVIGRKGSGKTSYLHAAYFENNYDYVVEISTPKAFCNIIESIEKNTRGALFPETIAELWETVLWIAFFSGVRDQLKTDSKKLINAYLAKIGIRENASIDDVLWNIADTLSEQAKGKSIGMIADILRKTDNLTFSQVKEAVNNELLQTKKRAVIMLDSLDDFHLEIESVSLAIQGLLKCIGRSNKPANRVDIRFCLPAELFHKFQAISSNPNKDFRRELLLHWTAPELLLIAANRLLLYFELFEPSYYEKYGKSCALNKADAHKVFEPILPNNITCMLGVKEDPLAYIYRHTQLLPRHFLIILNSIWLRNKRLHGGDYIIHEDSIILGVNAVEQRLVIEIFVAYKAVYPFAEIVCKQCFPELQHVFSIGDLERVFRTHGKKAFQSNDFIDFKRMLIEIGAVGRVINQSEKYVQAKFEYTVPYQLVTSTDDDLCLHPLFTEIFAAKTKLKKPVYPYGAMLDDPDYRDWD